MWIEQQINVKKTSNQFVNRKLMMYVRLSNYSKTNYKNISSIYLLITLYIHKYIQTDILYTLSICG